MGFKAHRGSEMAHAAVSLKTLTNDERLLINCPAGLTIGELMDEAKVPLDLRGYILPLNHGLPIRDLAYVTRPGDRITFCVMPQGKGGGQILGAIAMIALAVVAPYLGGLAAGALLGTTTGAAYTFASSAIALGITMIGSLLVSALVPPPSVANTKSDSVASPLQESPTYSVTGQSNQARKYAPIPRIYGRHRFYPNLASTPLIDNEGKTSRITALYDFGYGDITVQDLKIGELPFGTIAPDVRIHQNQKTPPLQLVSKSVSYDQLQYKLDKDVPVTVRTKDKSISATIDLNFPRGLVRYDQSGGRVVATAAFEVYYRKLGDPTWTRVSASQFRGLDVNVERVVWSTAYTNGVTEWMETTFQGGSNKWQDVEIRRDGAYLGRWVYGIGGTPQELNIGGVQYRKGSARDSVTVNAKASYTKYELQWATPVNTESTVLSAATGQSITCAVHITFPTPGVYEIQVVRKNDISLTNTLYNETFLTLIKSFRSGDVIKLDQPHTMLEMSVVASDKISGAVQNLSAICISRLRWHDGTSWKTPEETRNPVWIALDILTGAANKTPLRDDQLDMPSWLKLAAICDQQVTTTVNGVTTTQARYMCDVVIDFRTTVQEAISSILSGCRAQMIITASGKYGVLIDAEQTVPRQVFTPANSWGFGGNRSFTDKPHAFRVKFTDPDLAWQTAEFNVYNDGYDETNSTNFEDLTTFGITTYAQAYRFGRYMMAQGIHRSEIFSIKTDVENLAVQRGELVHVAHDVPKVGGMYARVKGITGSQIVIDQQVAFVVTSYTVRLSDGTIRSGAITSTVDGSTFDLDNVTGIETGDLIVVGETDRVVGKYLVFEISPGVDLTADISLVPYVPAIYKADEGPIPNWDPQFGKDVFKSDLVAHDLKAAYVITYVDRRPIGKLDLSWITDGFNLGTHQISVKVPGMAEFQIEGTAEQSKQWLIDLLARPDLAGKQATITVTPVSKTGLFGKPATASLNLDKDTTAPKPPAHFGLNVQSEVVMLFWQAEDDPDIDYYDIRFTPNVLTPAWDSSQHLARVGYLETRTSAGARTGTYMIRAVDTSGNKSTIEQRRTTVEVLPNINVIEIVNDRDAMPASWPGSLSGLVKDGNTLISGGAWGSVIPNGVYGVSKVVDLGDIDETRVSSMIEAYGASYDDFMSSWNPLSSVIPLAKASADTWDAWLEVSVSSSQTFMKDWVPNLAAVNPIGSAGGAVWSEWRPVNVGDFTGRLFKFRIVTRSYDPNVKVVVKSGAIHVDMPDRIWSISDVDIPPAGLTINYDPAFRATPTLAVTIDGNVDYLVAEITNKNARSFDLVLKNNSGIAKAGKVDVMAKGYGRHRAAPI